MARRVETTPSGSKETFKTSARLVPDDPSEPDDTKAEASASFLDPGGRKWFR